MIFFSPLVEGLLFNRPCTSPGAVKDVQARLSLPYEYGSTRPCVGNKTFRPLIVSPSDLYKSD